jgi:hypothetical protein
MKTGTLTTRPTGDFVRAAIVADLLVAAMLIVIFMVLPQPNRPFAVRTGLWLILLSSLAVWGIYTLLYAVDRTRRWFLRPAKASPLRKAILWDHWLDGPAR